MSTTTVVLIFEQGAQEDYVASKTPEAHAVMSRAMGRKIRRLSHLPRKPARVRTTPKPRARLQRKPRGT